MTVRRRLLPTCPRWTRCPPTNPLAGLCPPSQSTVRRGGRLVPSCRAQRASGESAAGEMGQQRPLHDSDAKKVRRRPLGNLD
jgi:hypothetical protein